MGNKNRGWIHVRTGDTAPFLPPDGLPVHMTVLGIVTFDGNDGALVEDVSDPSRIDRAFFQIIGTRRRRLVSKKVVNAIERLDNAAPVQISTPRTKRYKQALADAGGKVINYSCDAEHVMLLQQMREALGTKSDKATLDRAIEIAVSSIATSKPDER